MDTQLRILAGSIVTESKLSKPAKLQLLQFIQKEATVAQIKVLLMDGEIINLDKQAEEIVSARFEASGAGDRVKALARTTGSIGIAQGIYTTIPWAIYRKIKSISDACTKKCGTFQLNTIRRQLCMAKCNLPRRKAELAAAQKTKNKVEISKKLRGVAKAEAKLKGILNAMKSAGSEQKA